MHLLLVALLLGFALLVDGCKAACKGPLDCEAFQVCDNSGTCVAKVRPPPPNGGGYDGGEQTDIGGTPITDSGIVGAGDGPVMSFDASDSGATGSADTGIVPDGGSGPDIGPQDGGSGLGAWRQRTLPVSGAHLNGLSEGGEWAVGWQGSGNHAALILSHDGNGNWVESASGMQPNAELMRVSTKPGAGDAWAVGKTCTSPSTCTTFSEHWNGTTWSVVGTPGSMSAETVLSDVTEVSSGNAWAVGQDGAATTLLHWDGSVWQPTVLPVIAGDVLLAASAISANDVWVGGKRLVMGYYHPLAFHWDGSAWAVNMPPSLQDGFALQISTGAFGVLILADGSPGTAVDFWDGHFWFMITDQMPQTNSLVGLSGREFYATGVDKLYRWTLRGAWETEANCASCNLSAIAVTGSGSPKRVTAVGDALLDRLIP